MCRPVHHCDADLGGQGCCASQAGEKAGHPGDRQRRRAGLRTTVGAGGSASGFPRLARTLRGRRFLGSVSPGSAGAAARADQSPTLAVRDRRLVFTGIAGSFSGSPGFPGGPEIGPGLSRSADDPCMDVLTDHLFRAASSEQHGVEREQCKMFSHHRPRVWIDTRIAGLDRTSRWERTGRQSSGLDAGAGRAHCAPSANRARRRTERARCIIARAGGLLGRPGRSGPGLSAGADREVPCSAMEPRGRFPS